MIEIKITPKSKDVLVKTDKIGFFMRRNIRHALAEIGQEDVREVRRLITTGSRTGRVYRYRGRPHQASAAGEPPANRSGRLQKSANYKVRSHLEMTIGEEASYAVFLENGTRKMRPRQHLIRAINNNAGNTYVTLVEAGLC